jgi:hypothetical protein
MNRSILLVFTLFLFFSCKQAPKKKLTGPLLDASLEESKEAYFPEKLGNVFEKHGGLVTWRAAQVLAFNLKDERHTTNLQTRKTHIAAPNYSLGFDGKEVWLQQKDSTSFKGNKDFYYNLYFYFYAMPFVLADDGIVYEKIPDLKFEGKSYPGFKISYQANVGTSPDDNYFVYYHPETYQMEWLGYTVTFFSKKVNNDFHLIRYNSWEFVANLRLPKQITWYEKDENGQPTVPAKVPTDFSEALLLKTEMDPDFFVKPIE